MLSVDVDWGALHVGVQPQSVQQSDDKVPREAAHEDSP